MRTALRASALLLLGVIAAAEPAPLDWSRLRQAFDRFVELPSSENAIAVRTLLPAEHVPYETLSAHEETLDVIQRGFPMLERQVEARDPEAVRLAFALYSVMDGAAMEDLDIMLGKLIRIDAALFLRELSRRSDRTKYLEGLLGNQGEELVDRIRAKCLETKLRITALERVSDSDLRQLRDECLHLLRNDLGHCE